MTARRHLIAATLGIALLAPFAPAAQAATIDLVSAAQMPTAGSAEPASAQVFERPVLVNRIGDDPLAPVAQRALRAIGSPEFDVLRDQLATAIAERLWIDPAQMQQAWRTTTAQHQVALVAALTQLGVPYRRMRSNPGQGFDCSGLTTFAWGIAGRTLPRSSSQQIRNVKNIDRSQQKAGDLVWYPGHVMMSLGIPGAIIHSPFTGRDVEVDWLKGRRANSVRVADPTI
jgi:cell wall-associated NlpC family hydrolase